MRLRTLIAPTMGQAMDMLRRELGDDAIIVSTETTDHGTKIVAALEEAEEELPNIGAVVADPLGDEPVGDPIDLIHEALLLHGLPNRLLERLIDASFLVGTDEPVDALAGALGQLFTFQPLSMARGPNQPLMLFGAPGAGKTVSVAKLAARAVFAKRKVRLITTDTIRAGGIEQLEVFARIMKLPLHIAETDRQLTRLVDGAAPDEYVLIDTPGVNPYSPRDMSEVAGLAKAVTAEPMLVMAAGGDVVDSMEQAQEFATLGITRMLVTRLDMVRRLGSMLAAADAASLTFSDWSMTPAVADGLNPIDPKGLAKMLMPEPAPNTTAQQVTRGLRS
jgi:flagellar biosynthesis protein FlhF